VTIRVAAIMLAALWLSGCGGGAVVQTCRMTVDKQGNVYSDCGEWRPLK
jgi:hypothetical protein